MICVLYELDFVIMATYASTIYDRSAQKRINWIPVDVKFRHYFLENENLFPSIYNTIQFHIFRCMKIKVKLGK